MIARTSSVILSFQTLFNLLQTSSNLPPNSCSFTWIPSLQTFKLRPLFRPTIHPLPTHNWSKFVSPPLKSLKKQLWISELYIRKKGPRKKTLTWAPISRIIELELRRKALHCTAPGSSVCVCFRAGVTLSFLISAFGLFFSEVDERVHWQLKWVKFSKVFPKLFFF